MKSTTTVIETAAGQGDAVYEQAARYPLLSALLDRRSRRFGRGMRLNGGPLEYQSTQEPKPLTLHEEAVLAFAACGITGPPTAEIPYTTGNDFEAGTGNVLTQLVGRTVGSADAIHTVILFVINDQGAWMLKRPQDYPRPDVAGLAAAARDHRFTELYQKSRVRIADRRIDIPRETQVMMPFNKWAANVAGSTYYVPVNELSAFYINVMLMLFSDDMACFMIDDRNGFRPAGVNKFAKSKGGYLHDDPRSGRYLLPVSYVEGVIAELAAIEQGMMLQNLALMSEALGLGGFSHFAAHPFLWLQTLGFNMEVLPFTRTAGAGKLMQTAAKLLHREQPFPTAVGLERDGQVLVKPFCPPYYRNMEEAVLAFVDLKFAPRTGTYRDGGANSAWRDGAAIQNDVPRHSDRAIAATIAYCDYIYRRYGRLPAAYGTCKTVLAFQAHHLDTTFYDRFYKPDVLRDAHRGRG